MSGYTSGKTTHDPEPWRLSSGSRHSELVASIFPEVVRFNLTAYDPRPEFDNHNPILVAFRADPDIDLWDMGFAMHTTYGGERTWERPDHYFHSFTIATPEQIAHARRVLTRLVARS